MKREHVEEIAFELRHENGHATARHRCYCVGCDRGGLCLVQLICAPHRWGQAVDMNGPVAGCSICERCGAEK